MYIPQSFSVDDLPLLHQFMRDNSFATVVTGLGESPFATHVPVIVDHAPGQYGTIRSHVARANPQWHHFEHGAEVLTIFSGPHTYISPSWYRSELQVPTWNYCAVHAYGTAKVVDDEGLHQILTDLVEQNESARPQPWKMESLPADFVEKLMGAIVGFEIEITRLEGKFKMSQNKGEADLEGAIAGLEAAGDSQSAHVAHWMRRLSPATTH